MLNPVNRVLSGQDARRAYPPQYVGLICGYYSISLERGAIVYVEGRVISNNKAVINDVVYRRIVVETEIGEKINLFI